MHASCIPNVFSMQKLPQFVNGYAAIVRVLVQGVLYACAVGCLTHVFARDVPFDIMVLSCVIIWLNMLLPVHQFAIKTRNFYKKVLALLFGTATGTGMVYVMNESFFSRPFYLRDLVLCVAGGIFFGSVYLAWVAYQHKQTRMHRILQSVSARKKLAEEQLELNRYRLLAAQIQPHFFFNTLANVIALMKTDTERASTLMTALVEYLQNVLAISSQATVDIKIELNAARNYLKIQSMRFQRLDFSIDVPDAMGHLQIPPLVLLTLVENAVHHGIGGRPGAGHIEVRGKIEGVLCHLMVIDDGNGVATKGSESPFPPHEAWVHGSHTTHTHGMGLENVRKRIASTYGAMQSEVRLLPRDDGKPGCIACVTIPFSPPPFAGAA